MTGNHEASAADYARLGKAIEDRRFDRGLSQEALVKHGGPSHQIVRNVEKGVVADYRDTTFRKFDRALQWRDGTTKKILLGTATDEEIAETVVRPVPIHDKTGGASMTGHGRLEGPHVIRRGEGGDQVIYPESVPSQAAFGEPTFTVEPTTAALATKLLGRLTADRELTPEKLAVVTALSALIPQLYEGRE